MHVIFAAKYHVIKKFGLTSGKFTKDKTILIKKFSIFKTRIETKTFNMKITERADMGC